MKTAESFEAFPDHIPAEHPTLIEERKGNKIKYEMKLGALKEVEVVNEDFTNMVSVKDTSSGRIYDIDLSAPERSHLFPKSSR